MINLLMELDYLKIILINKGFDEKTADSIIEKARSEINSIIEQESGAAMQLAIEEGVEKESADFINQLKLNRINLELTTESGNMDFSEPPKPMLPFLLRNAKPIKDGSGVYKIIPVGSPSSKPKPLVSSNIYDAWKHENAVRAEAAKVRRQNITPKGSVADFKTATSKQNSATQWVQPAKEKDFTESVDNINRQLSESLDDKIKSILQEYMEAY
jgi:hypothetical protein